MPSPFGPTDTVQVSRATGGRLARWSVTATRLLVISAVDDSVIAPSVTPASCAVDDRPPGGLAERAPVRCRYRAHMDFWSTFWATMWGALAGAVVAALSAWLFALDLRRRDRRDAYRDGMDAATATIITALGEYNAAARAEARNLAADRLGSRARLFAAIRVALIRASDDDDAPFKATLDLVSSSRYGDGSEERAAALTHASRRLTEWRQGDLTPHEAELRIRAEIPLPQL